MSEPKTIKDIIAGIAADPENEFSKILRQCPFIQRELLAMGAISLDDLSPAECDKLMEEDIIDNLLDGQDVMQKLHISPRTLQTLRSNGTIPYIKIGHKIYYHRSDIDRVLRSSYVMFKIKERYGKGDK